MAVLQLPRFAQILCRGSFSDGRPTPWLFVDVIEVVVNFLVAAFQKPMGKFAFADLLVLVSLRFIGEMLFQRLCADAGPNMS